MSDDKTLRFYDIHCHVMDLSHPCLYAYLRRFIPSIPLVFFKNPMLFALAPAWLILGIFGKQDMLSSMMYSRLKNLINNLSVWERSSEQILEILQNDFADILRNHAKDHPIDKFVITPLMMDFYVEKIPDEISYNFMPKKILNQLDDLFSGIKSYSENSPKDSRMNVFPFMGINTQHIKMKAELDELKNKGEARKTENSLEDLLNKYFGSSGNNDDRYKGDFTDLERNQGIYDGNIENIGVNHFAGIKVYPPLGFDPWPDDQSARTKVKILYKILQDRKIPITTHCSDGGYHVGDTKDAIARTHPSKWHSVLKEFNNLKLNLAHFGGEKSAKALAAKIRRGGGVSASPNPACPTIDWADYVAFLVTEYENVFTDISYCGHQKEFYDDLKLILQIKGENAVLEDKVLFGSDFTINLLNIDTYKKYLENFFSTEYINFAQKKKMYNINPERFLFQT